jgi:DNA topoisomerase-1
VGKRSVSLAEDADLAAVTLADIEALLVYPRVLGADPESGVEIVVKRGRYGVYVDRDGDTRPVPAEMNGESLTMDEALELLARPKKGRGKR